ncbi:TA system antitoxin ParD family protein [Corynebacterium nuruki]|uniref:TA system antitoxin ParD family protein n=1 Tax=Corynebacterium nuruki TaxID=1032851 RepID=UPI0039BF5124
MTTTPVRIDSELFAQAKKQGDRASRSAAQQIMHWAKVGRELENAPTTSQRDIDKVLSGEASYDALTDKDQAVVRASWEDGISARLAGLNFQEEFTAAGRSWSESDAEGNLVKHDARSKSPTTGKDVPQ